MEIIHVFFPIYFQGTLAEPFKFDHDLTLGVYYENVEVPCVIIEPGSLSQGE